MCKRYERERWERQVNTEPLTAEEWKQIKYYFKNRCAYCGKRERNLEKDHIRALCKNGKTSKANIVPACRHCNASKHDKDFETWFKQQPFFEPVRLAKINVLIYFKGHNVVWQYKYPMRQEKAHEKNS